MQILTSMLFSDVELR